MAKSLQFPRGCVGGWLDVPPGRIDHATLYNSVYSALQTLPLNPKPNLPTTSLTLKGVHLSRGPSILGSMNPMTADLGFEKGGGTLNHRRENSKVYDIHDLLIKGTLEILPKSGLYPFSHELMSLASTLYFTYLNCASVLIWTGSYNTTYKQCMIFRAQLNISSETQIRRKKTTSIKTEILLRY